MLFIYFLIALVVGGTIIYNSYTLKNNPEINTEKFEKKFFNEMYLLSFGIPFKWFADDDDRPTEKKTLELKKTIALGGYDKYFTLRSFMTFKVVVAMAMLLAGGFVVVMVDYWHIVSKLLFAVESEPIEMELLNKVMILFPFLAVSLIPNIILKSKVKKKLKDDVKDIPVLQMFIILMLRSNKTIAEILYSLSRIDTPHKEAFEKSYRPYQSDASR